MENFKYSGKGSKHHINMHRIRKMLPFFFINFFTSNAFHF